MKEELRVRMQRMLERINTRIYQLSENVDHYVSVGNYQDAAKCDIKRMVFQLVANDLINELK